MADDGKKIKNDDALDRISDLPINIIGCVLDRLPLPDAVRTSVLSGKWRDRWKGMECLVFDGSLWNCIFGTRQLAYKDYTTIVDRVLLLHEGSVREAVFVQYIDVWGPDISPWVAALMRKKIKKLKILNYFGGGHYLQLSSCLFFCTELTHLQLHGCTFEPPRGFGGFNHLISLSLHKVVSACSAQTLISKSPLLETLNLMFSSRHKGSMLIDASKLKTLYVTQGPQVLYLNTPNLTYISLYRVAVMQMPNLIASNFAEFLCHFPKLDDILLDTSVLHDKEFSHMFKRENIPKTLPRPLGNLNQICLDDFLCGASDHISYLFCLIRSSPSLTTVQLCIYGSGESEDSVLECLEGQGREDYSSCIIRSVDISLLRGTKYEMMLIKCFLSCFTMLRTMHVHLADIDVEEKLDILREFIRFPRASANAEVICCSPDGSYMMH